MIRWIGHVIFIGPILWIVYEWIKAEPALWIGLGILFWLVLAVGWISTIGASKY